MSNGVLLCDNYYLMHIQFEHIFGTSNTSDFHYYVASLADITPAEYNTALEQGWLAECKDGEVSWYQTRSTRINLAGNNYKKYNDDVINYIIFKPDEIPTSELDHIYDSYCYHKKFKKYFEVDQYPAWDTVVGYLDENSNLCAYSKLRRYSPISIETVMFAWDYKNPSLQLGKQSLYWELEWCQQQGYTHAYTGSGYEKSSLYKADYPGFEWWDGKEWTTDIDHYKWLLTRDSKITTISDLGGLRITR